MRLSPRKNGLFFDLVNPEILTKKVRISGFSSLFSAIAAFLAHSGKCAESTAIARKREENPEILADLVRKRLTRFLQVTVFKVWPCPEEGGAELICMSHEGFGIQELESIK